MERFRVGAQVNVRFGRRTIPATVIEDRGDYGTPPVQVVRVSWTPEDVADPEEFEVSVRDVELTAA